jgi:hypothetical protein
MKKLSYNKISPKENKYLDKLVSLLVDRAYDEIQENVILSSSKTRKTSKK